MDVTANNRLDVDAQTEVDGLERSRFTNYLLNVLMQVNVEHGAVVGLEGNWGSGKTWVLRQLEPLAEEHASGQRLLFLHFNPWMVSGALDLVAAMLGQLSKQLAEQGRKSTTGSGKRLLTKAVKAIDKYAGALTAVKHAAPAFNLLVPGAGIVVGGIAAGMETVGEVARKVVPALPEAAAKKSLPALREEIRKALEAFDRKIVVIIDDLDRITPAEIAAMVQAVKAVADFPNVVYLLAYERDTLADALRDSLRLKNGHAYLEKIVQLPVGLPELPARRMQQFAEIQLRLALPADIPNDEVLDVENGVTIVAALMQTPRDVRRLRTRLMIVLRELRGEVNLADVMVAEAICLKLPAWLEWMRRHEGCFIEPGSGQYDPIQRARGLHSLDLSTMTRPENERKQEHEARRAELQQLGVMSIAQRRAYINAVEYLFDRARGNHVEQDRPTQIRRLQKHRFWYRWICFCDQQEPISVAEMQSYALDPSAAARAGWFDSTQTFDEFCKQFSDLAGEGLTSADAVRWAETFLDSEKALGIEILDRPDWGAGPFEVLRCWLYLEPSTAKKSSAMRLILSRASLSFCALVLIRGRQRMDSSNPRPDKAPWRELFADSTALSEARAIWMRRVREYLHQEMWLCDGSKLPPMYLLSWAFHAGEPADGLRAISEKLLQQADRLNAFFGSMAQGSYESSVRPNEVTWDVLPATARLAELVEASDQFKQSHPTLSELILSKARKEVAANQPLAPDPV
jgi:predicted KAP-like P-loop ATPase